MNRSLVLIATVVALLVGAAPAWSLGTCGGAPIQVTAEIVTQFGNFANTPIDLPGAESGGTILTPGNGNVELQAGINFSGMLGADFWHSLDPGNCDSTIDVYHADCNDDPRAVVDGSQWTMTSLAGNAGEYGQAGAPDSIYIATASNPSSMSSGWTKNLITGACDHFPSGDQVPDFPQLAISGNWIVVENYCLDPTSGNSVGEEIHVIDKNTFYSSGIISDTKFTSRSPAAYFEIPLNSRNGDPNLYLAVPETAKGNALVVFGEISGSPGSPVYSSSVASTTISVSGTKSGVPASGSARVPDLDQANCTFCLGHAKDFVSGDGAEDTWANGHSVLEFAFPQKYGGTSNAGVADGSSIVEVVTWDLTASNSPFSWWSSDSTQAGGIAHSWPSIAHAVVNGSDHLVITDTLARHQAGNTHHPTNEILRITDVPPTALASNESGIDEHDSQTHVGNRWGDYSTTMYDSGRGKIESFGDCTDNFGSTNPTLQTNIYNEVSP